MGVMIRIGVDEAGRGALAGPVYAAAVVWPTGVAAGHADERLIRDSKTLSLRQRMRARELVERRAPAWGVGVASVEEIDERNILRATMLAMHRAIAKAVAMLGESAPDGGAVELVIDGNYFEPYWHTVDRPSTTESTSATKALFLEADVLPHTCVIKGDALVPAIAAASILAKTHRDELMSGTLHAQHPEFGWDRNAGYGSAAHMRELGARGPTPHHRRSFAPVRRAQAAADASSPDGRAT